MGWGGAVAQDPAARALIDAGVAGALGTTFNALYSHIDHADHGRTRFLRQELTPEEAFSAANINGAHALGWKDRIGSLELGKHADNLILNASNYASWPITSTRTWCV